MIIEWSEYAVSRVFESQIVYEEKTVPMIVSQWIVPRDLAQGQSIHFLLEMFSQLKAREPKGHVIFHKYRLLVSNGSLSAPVDAPGDAIEDALAQGKCAITAAIVSSDGVREHIKRMAQPLASKIDEISQLIASTK